MRGSLDDIDSAACNRGATIRIDARNGRKGSGYNRFDACRRYARIDDDRRNWRRADGVAATRRPFDGGACLASGDTRADFRRRGILAAPADLYSLRSHSSFCWQCRYSASRQRPLPPPPPLGMSGIRIGRVTCLRRGAREVRESARTFRAGPAPRRPNSRILMRRRRERRGPPSHGDRLVARARRPR